MADDQSNSEFDKRLHALALLTSKDVQRIIKGRLTKAQRQELHGLLERMCIRWMDNLDEMWAEDDGEDDPLGIDRPPAGNA